MRAQGEKNERTDCDIEFFSSAVIKGHGFVPRLSDAIFSGYCTGFHVI